MRDPAWAGPGWGHLVDRLSSIASGDNISRHKDVIGRTYDAEFDHTMPTYRHSDSPRDRQACPPSGCQRNPASSTA